MSTTLDLKQQEFINIIDELAIQEKHINTKTKLLARVEELTQNHPSHQSHNSHCKFGRDGGGHFNVCIWGDDDVNLISEDNLSPLAEDYFILQLKS